MGQLHAPVTLAAGKNTVPIEYEDGWAPSRCERFAPIGNRSPTGVIAANNVTALCRRVC